jgi:hypothetical protein
MKEYRVVENEFEMIIERQVSKLVSKFNLFNQTSLPINLVFCIFKKTRNLLQLN